MGDLAPLLGRTLALVAHADDETVGCGALLQRISSPVVVFATDSAPRDEFFWKPYGSRLRYARMREDEARQALGNIGVTEVEFLASLAQGVDAFADQELFLNLDQAFELLSAMVRRQRPEALLTLAYEGGHPDHDACSFLGSVLAREFSLACWEVPLYHRAVSGEVVYQEFIHRSGNEVPVEITPEELDLKRAMFAAYASQRDVLKSFDPEVETVRPQPSYDYSQPPHPGMLNYEAWQWRMTGPQVCSSFARFLQDHRSGMSQRGSDLLATNEGSQRP
jgi:LmbE family N-acetylglucosaminyl deacetylase